MKALVPDLLPEVTGPLKDVALTERYTSLFNNDSLWGFGQNKALGKSGKWVNQRRDFIALHFMLTVSAAVFIGIKQKHGYKKVVAVRGTATTLSN